MLPGVRRTQLSSLTNPGPHMPPASRRVAPGRCWTRPCRRTSGRPRCGLRPLCWWCWTTAASSSLSTPTQRPASCSAKGTLTCSGRRGTSWWLRTRRRRWGGRAGAARDRGQWRGRVLGPGTQRIHWQKDTVCVVGWGGGGGVVLRDANLGQIFVHSPDSPYCSTPPVHAPPSRHTQAEWAFALREADESYKRHAIVPRLALTAAGGRRAVARDVAVFRVDSLEDTPVGQAVLIRDWSFE